MTIMELAAIPLWTLGIASAITGALALVLARRRRQPVYA